jgi:purine-binding chemotaxis protein CheW
MTEDRATEELENTIETIAESLVLLEPDDEEALQELSRLLVCFSDLCADTGLDYSAKACAVAAKLLADNAVRSKGGIEEHLNALNQLAAKLQLVVREGADERAVDFPPQFLPPAKDEVAGSGEEATAAPEVTQAPVQAEEPPQTVTEREIPEEDETDALAQHAGKYLTFDLADEAYGIAIEKVREIIQWTDITRLPRTYRHIRGLINLRGQVVPILDLRVLFDLDVADVTEETCIAIIQTRQQMIGIIVDRVSEVLNVGKQQIDPPPPACRGIDQSFLIGMAKVDESVKLLLDIDGVIDYGTAG